MVLTFRNRIMLCLAFLVIVFGFQVLGGLIAWKRTTVGFKSVNTVMLTAMTFSLDKIVSFGRERHFGAVVTRLVVSQGQPGGGPIEGAPVSLPVEMGSACRKVLGATLDGQGVDVSCVAVGIPFVWLWRESVEDTGAMTFSTTINSTGAIHGVYTGLDAVGLMANVGVWGTAFAVIVLIQYRLSSAWRRGCCRACGYSRVGLKAESVCPECGTDRSQQPSQ